MATRPSAKPAAKAASKTAAPATLTLKHLAAEIADSHELTKKQADQILNDTVALVVKNLKKGARIRLAGLGIFQVRPHGAQSCDRRADQDQGEQEDRLPRRQGAQGSHLRPVSGGRRTSRGRGSDWG